MPDLEDRENRERRIVAALMLLFSDLKIEFLKSGRYAPMRTRGQLEETLQDHLRRSYNAAGQNFKRALADRIAKTEKHRAAVALLGSHREDGAAWARDYAGEAAKAMAETTGEWIKQLRKAGASREEIAAKVFSRARAEGVAISNTTDSVSAAEVKLASDLKKLGMKMVAIWRTSGLDNVCPICKPLDGKRKTVWGRKFPNGPKAHPRCLLPGTVIRSIGPIVGAAKSFYRGRIVEITLANGRRVTVTANHLILTPSGWIEAQRLNKGTYVACGADFQIESPATPDPYDYHGNAAVENVFRSLMKAGGMVSSRMPATAKDFDCDAGIFDEKVDVVRADSFLMSDLLAKVSEHRSKFGFVAGRDFGSSLNLRGPKFFFGQRNNTTTASSVSVCEHGFPLGVASSLPSQSPGVASIAQIQSGFDDSFSKSSATDFESLGETQEAFPRSISVDNLSEVCGINVYSYSGHVYDFSAPVVESVVANGVISHNCNCFLDWEVVIA